MTRPPSESFTRTLQTAVDAIHRILASIWLGFMLTAILDMLRPLDEGGWFFWTLTSVSIWALSARPPALRETAASDPVEQEQGGLPI